MSSIVEKSHWPGIPPVSPRVAARPIFVAILCIALGLFVAPYFSSQGALLARLAWTFALLSAMGSVFAAAWNRSPDDSGNRPRDHRTASIRMAALWCGVLAGLIQTILLLTRFLYVVADIVNGFPWRGEKPLDFSPQGLGTCGLLFASCAVALQSTGELRLHTCLLWCTVMIGAWTCLLSPVYQPTIGGGMQPTGITLALLACLSAVLTIAGFWGVWLERRRQPRRDANSFAWRTGRDRSWPGFHLSGAVLSALVVLLVCYHLAVPLPTPREGWPWGLAVLVISSGGSGWAAVSLAVRSGRGVLLDCGFGLATLTLCGLTTLAVPNRPDLGERYPMLFNAMLFGATASAAAWYGLARRWGKVSSDDSLTSLPFWMAPYARRAAFFAAVIALVFAAMMAVWPRLPSIAAMDHSLGRMAAGLAANLLLLSVLMWIAQVSRRPTSYVMWFLALLSTTGFVVARVIPFTPRFG